MQSISYRMAAIAAMFVLAVVTISADASAKPSAKPRATYAAQASYPAPVAWSGHYQGHVMANNNAGWGNVGKGG
jgi:hypothetical protein